jgi:hypothetical protein
MTTEVLKLFGNVVGISSSDPFGADEENLVLYVKGASSLYVELQLPNGHECSLGQRVVVLVIALPAIKPVASVN